MSTPRTIQLSYESQASAMDMSGAARVKQGTLAGTSKAAFEDESAN